MHFSEHKPALLLEGGTGPTDSHADGQYCIAMQTKCLWTGRELEPAPVTVCNAFVSSDMTRCMRP